VGFGRLYHIHRQRAWFVTRPKINMNYRWLYSAKADMEKGVKVDQTIKLNNHYAAKDYPKKLRPIKFYDSEKDLELEFITNNFELDAKEVELLYKHRWRVELFFEWIKQHLKIKSLLSTSENAVRIQVYTAI
jgi:hypothetical protein